MPFSGAATNAEIDASMGAIVLLNSSCQAVIEAEIAEVASPWYDQLDQELGAAENLVVGWRRSGVLYFQTDILDTIAAAGQAFVAAAPQIDALFAALEQRFSAGGKAELITAMQALEPPIQAMIGQIADYLGKLQTFEQAMLQADQAMRNTVGQVQAQEQQIQGEIDAINNQIKLLNVQIQTDREAIARAKAARTRGIIETIFGVVFAPLTGGASLILAGIGVASIAEAEGQINAMQSEISGYQQKIASDQSALTDDQRIVATLGALTMSTGLVLSDMAMIENALDSLRTGWTALDGELGGVIAKLQAATSAADLIVSQAWYTAACTEWNLIDSHVADLTGRQIDTSRVRIG
ncbi:MULTISPECIES: alpha-pore-forming cytotoxin subunit MakE [unclassified Bradyrhizobium]|uniref:alpha-pore-forming cytotoxin subunit MakE n=1 Tax=unclassified Bradyrhizobium TaxID=2631580 RepID=UPI0030D3D283